jgi:cytoskeletal protein CcmA (bactofilin family)
LQLQEAREAVAAATATPLAMTAAPTSPTTPTPVSAATGISIVPKGPTYVDGETPSVIGESLTIEGQSITIRCKGALEVNGNIQAELHSQRLVVGRSGKVEGTITADHVDIWGRVSGTIMGARVSLHSSAEVEGDIHAQALTVLDGASFEGRSRRVTDPTAVAPKLESTATTSPTGEITVPLPRSV